MHTQSPARSLMTMRQWSQQSAANSNIPVLYPVKNQNRRLCASGGPLGWHKDRYSELSTFPPPGMCFAEGSGRVRGYESHAECSIRDTKCISRIVSHQVSRCCHFVPRKP